MPISPLLSNFVLKKFDAYFERKNAKMIRYADDFVIFAKSESDCIDNFTDARRILNDIGHTIPDIGAGSKSIIRRPDEPIDFLGFDIIESGFNSYQLCIPSVAFDEMQKNLEKYSNFGYALKHHRTLESALISMNNMVQGYVAVYGMAANIGAFRDSARSRLSNNASKLLTEIFGKKAVQNLTGQHKRFLGLTY